MVLLNENSVIIYACPNYEKIFECNPTGKKVWEVKRPPEPFVVMRRNQLRFNGYEKLLPTKYIQQVPDAKGKILNVEVVPKLIEIRGRVYNRLIVRLLDVQRPAVMSGEKSRGAEDGKPGQPAV